jgi:hypothetical protein
VAEYTNEQILDVCREIARVASCVCDGEDCGKLLSPRAMKILGAASGTLHPHTTGDNIDYDAPRYERAKKLLMRIQRLRPEGLDVQCLLWAPVAGAEDKVVQEIFNGGPSRWPLNVGAHETDEPMKQVMATGEPVELSPNDHNVTTVLAPVRDSLQDVTGFVEVSAAVPTEFGVQGVG